MPINFISSKNFEETSTFWRNYIQQVITEILRGSETDNIIVEFFESLLQRYQKAREKSNWFIVLLFS